MLRISRLIMASLFCFEMVFANDLSTGGGAQLEPKNSTTAVSNGVLNTCPSALSNLVKSDFENKGAVLGLISVKSQAQQCQTKLNEALVAFKSSSNVSSLSEKESATNTLLGSFSQIGSIAGSSMNKCNTLNSNDDLITKTRYIHAVGKLEGMSSSLVDELAYIDSMLPSEGGLSKISQSCQTSQLFPKLAKKCADYSSQMSATCSKSPEEKLTDLTETSLNKLGEYSDLNEMLRRCEHNVHSKNEGQKSSDCFEIRRLMESMLVKYPWISTPQFYAIKESIRNRNSWTPEIREKMFKYTKERVRSYLSQTRDSLVEQFKKNQTYSKCLTTNADLNPADCNTEKISKLLDQLPEPVIKKETNIRKLETPEYIVLGKLFDTEKCIADRRLEQQKKVDLINTVTEVGITAVTTVLTAGTFLITSSGLKIVQGINRTNQLRNLARVNVALNAVGTAANASSVYMKCRNVEAISKLSDMLPEVALKNNICPDPKMSQLQDQDDTCALQSLMVVGNMATLGAGLGVFSKIAGKRNAELQEFIDLVKKPGSQNRDLRFASSLTMTERIQVTEAALGRKLSPEQIKALKKAHELGPFDFDPESILTREKDEILQAAGFSKRESAVIRGNGLAGSFGSDESFLGRTVSITRSDGSRSSAEIIGVVERDASGNVVKYKVGWKTADGSYATKTVKAEETFIKYDSGDTIYFKRSSGDYSQGTVLSNGVDDKGQFYTVFWKEDGHEKFKKVYSSEVTHVDPVVAIKVTEAEQAKRAADEARKAAAHAQAEKEAAEVAAVRQAVAENPEKVAEMERIARIGAVTTPDDIRLALNMQGASISDLRKQVRRLLQSYHADKLPAGLKKWADSSSQVLTDMNTILRNAEKSN